MYSLGLLGRPQIRQFTQITGFFFVFTVFLLNANIFLSIASCNFALQTFYTVKHRIWPKNAELTDPKCPDEPFSVVVVVALARKQSPFTELCKLN